MSDTVAIPLPVDEWQLIGSGPVSGYVSNESNGNFIVQEAATASPPTTSRIGHTVSRNDIVGFNYILAAGQSIYGLASSGKTSATRTQES